MRLIDADALMGLFRGYMNAKYNKEKCISAEDCEKCNGCLWKKVVDKAPTIDAEPVVRCKDCIHRVEESKMCMHPKAIGWDAIEPEDDDCCSYGERRNSNDD